MPETRKRKSSPVISSSAKNKKTKVKGNKEVPDRIVTIVENMELKLKKDYPGLLFAYADSLEIHRAISFNGQRPPGVNVLDDAAKTAANFKDWVHNECKAIAPNCAVLEGDGELISAYHGLKGPEFIQILQRINQYSAWAEWTRNNGTSVGQCYTIFGAGRGRVTISLFDHLGPFNR